MPDQKVFRQAPNPLDLDAVVSIVGKLESDAPRHHSVSLTGGEPLLHVAFLRDFCPRLRDLGLKVYLETNGTLLDALEELLPFVDVVAMDFKLKSATGAEPDMDLNRAFLALASKKEVFVKAIVASSTLSREIEDCAAVIAGVDKRIPLIIQPVAPVVDNTDAPKTPHLIQLHVAAGRILDDVRVIPQVHKMLGAM